MSRGFGRRRQPPKDWYTVSRVGDVIDGIFLPIRTPLDESYLVDLEELWTPKVFVDYIEKEGIDVGLIINLSGKEDYYFWTDGISRNKIYYKHIPLTGRVTPHGGQRYQFIRTCNEFLYNNPGKIIAVHCTHGCNRTGFMICNYLCNQRGWNVEEAMSYFAARRPPGIYQEYCYEGLRKVYAGELPKNPQREKKSYSNQPGKQSSTDRANEEGDKLLIPAQNPWRPRLRGGPTEPPPTHGLCNFSCRREPGSSRRSHR